MQKKTSAPVNHAPNAFIEKHRKDVMGILHSFDRLRLQGSLRYLYCAEIFEEYLSKAKVLCKDFKQHAQGVTAEVCRKAQELAQSLGRPYTYLASSRLSKEEEAQRIVEQDGLKEGLVAVFSCVEPCRTYKMRGNYQTKMLEPRLEWGKCLHLYFYVQHPRFGLLHLRLQTWYPFLIHICLNGHEWLARQMEAKGLSYRKSDNKFTWVEDFAVAQALADEQLRTDWVALCEGLRRTYHPLHEQIGRPLNGLSYYWTAPQTEFASDVIFHDQASLDRLFPRLILHGILNLGCEQVMRFLGKQLNGRFGGEVVTDLRRGSEGVRLKHWVNDNSIKLYNHLNVLRPETTIHDAEDLKVYRTPESRPDGPKAWYPLRRGVADLHRRAQISKAANERYLSGFGGDQRYDSPGRRGGQGLPTGASAPAPIPSPQSFRSGRRPIAGSRQPRRVGAQGLSQSGDSGFALSAKPRTKSKNAPKPPRSRDDWPCSTPTALSPRFPTPTAGK